MNYIDKCSLIMSIAVNMKSVFAAMKALEKVSLYASVVAHVFLESLDIPAVDITSI